MQYAYLAFPRTSVIGVAALSNYDATGDPMPHEESIKQALADGYRWVRTDGDFAIFEKVTGTLTEREAWLLSDVSHVTRTKIDSVQYMELQMLARKLYNWRKDRG